MKKQLLAAACAAGMMVSAQAQNAVENWSGFANVNAIATTTSSLPNAGTPFDVFGGSTTFPTFQTTGGFPGLPADGNLSLNGGTELAFGITCTTGIAATNGTILFALPIRVDSIAAAAGDNDLDLLFMGGAAADPDSPRMGIVRILDGNLILSYNGWDAQIIAPGVADPAADAAIRWNDGTWRLLIGRLNPQEAAGVANFWVLKAGDTTATALNTITQSSAGVAVPAGGFTAIQIGQKISVPAAARSGLAVTIDDLVFFDSAAVTTTAQLATAAGTQYGVGGLSLAAPSSVEDWNIF